MSRSITYNHSQTEQRRALHLDDAGNLTVMVTRGGHVVFNREENIGRSEADRLIRLFESIDWASQPFGNDTLVRLGESEYRVARSLINQPELSEVEALFEVPEDQFYVNSASDEEFNPIEDASLSHEEWVDAGYWAIFFFGAHAAAWMFGQICIEHASNFGMLATLGAGIFALLGAPTLAYGVVGMIMGSYIGERAAKLATVASLIGIAVYFAFKWMMTGGIYIDLAYIFVPMASVAAKFGSKAYTPEPAIQQPLTHQALPAGRRNEWQTDQPL